MWKYFVPIGATICWLNAAPVFAGMIDNFEQGAINPPIGSVEQSGRRSNNFTQLDLNPDETLSGVRNIIFYTYRNTSNATLTLAPDRPNTIDDKIQLEIAPGKSGVSLQISYYGDDYNNNLNLDLTADGGDRFIVNFVEAPPSGNFIFFVPTSSGFGSSKPVQITGKGLYEVPFSAITDSDFGTPVDFTDVSHVSLQLNASSNPLFPNHYSISEIRTVNGTQN